MTQTIIFFKPLNASSSLDEVMKLASTIDLFNL
jgi:hypothetical protein